MVNSRHVLRRDGIRCQACGTRVLAVLAAHHIIPLHLGGRDTLKNLTTLCANCHRMVHWLATGDRSLKAHGFDCGTSPSNTRTLLKLARRVRDRRVRDLGPSLVRKSAFPLETALEAVARRNGLDNQESRLMKRCVKRVIRQMGTSLNSQCAFRVVRQERFLSILAKNYLVFRAPAWTDDLERLQGDMLLIWPCRTAPSVLSKSEFKRLARSGFAEIRCFNVPLSWQECLDLGAGDWRAFRSACRTALASPTRRWPSNVKI